MHFSKDFHINVLRRSLEQVGEGITLEQIRTIFYKKLPKTMVEKIINEQIRTEAR